MTSTVVEMALHSWNPASTAPGSPVPRSMRKLNWAYGVSRNTAISASPEQIVVGQFEFFHGDVVRLGIERRPRPPRRPGSDQPPGIDDPSARSRELTDRHVTPVLLAGDDRAPPFVQLGADGERAPEDDRGESVAVVASAVGCFGIRRRRQGAHLGESVLPIADQDDEIADPEERLFPACRHRNDARRRLQYAQQA